MIVYSEIFSTNSSHLISCLFWVSRSTFLWPLPRLKKSPKMTWKGNSDKSPILSISTGDPIHMLWLKKDFKEQPYAWKWIPFVRQSSKSLARRIFFLKQPSGKDHYYITQSILKISSIKTPISKQSHQKKKKKHLHQVIKRQTLILTDSSSSQPSFCLRKDCMHGMLLSVTFSI